MPNPYNLPMLPGMQEEDDIEMMEQEVNQNMAMEMDPESLLETPGTSYEEKLEAMQRIKDRYLKPRES